MQITPQPKSRQGLHLVLFVGTLSATRPRAVSSAHRRRAAPQILTAARILMAGGCDRKLLDQVRSVLRTRHYADRTEQCDSLWIERSIRFGVRGRNSST